MKAYIDKVALVAEIERRLKGLEDCHADRIVGYAGEISGLKRLLSFIDTLEVKEVNEEPASDDLEEAADYYASMASQAYKGVYCEYCNDKVAFKAGAKWQKEQTIYKACNYLFSHMGLFVTFFDDDIVEDIERSEFIKKFRIEMEE